MRWQQIIEQTDSRQKTKVASVASLNQLVQHEKKNSVPKRS
jgi:uncharacterized lipoprotein YajG